MPLRSCDKDKYLNLPKIFRNLEGIPAASWYCERLDGARKHLNLAK